VSNGSNSVADRHYHLTPVGFVGARLIQYLLCATALSVVMTITSVFADPVPQLYSAQGRAANLAPETLREIFFMRRTTWPDGTPISVFVLPDTHPLHIRFAKRILGVYPFQLRSAWDRLIYSGTGLPPFVVDSVEEMRARVQATPGSIGYVGQ
jgi:ABC-type phosphate transport system, periplasmic component